jgi:hypothetical protein
MWADWSRGAGWALNLFALGITILYLLNINMKIFINICIIYTFLYTKTWDVKLTSKTFLWSMHSGTFQNFYRQVFTYCILFEYKSEWGGRRVGSKEKNTYVIKEGNRRVQWQIMLPNFLFKLSWIPGHLSAIVRL